MDATRARAGMAARRRLAVQRVWDGVATAQLATVLGVHVETVRLWALARSGPKHRGEFVSSCSTLRLSRQAQHSALKPSGYADRPMRAGDDDARNCRHQECVLGIARLR